MLMFLGSACRCFSALLFASPHPQPPRNQSVAKGKNAKPSLDQRRRGSLSGFGAHKAQSDEARGREGPLEHFRVFCPYFYDNHQGHLPGVLCPDLLPRPQSITELLSTETSERGKQIPAGKVEMPAWPAEHLCWSSPAEPASLRVTPPPTQKKDVCSSMLHVRKLRSK